MAERRQERRGLRIAEFTVVLDVGEEHSLHLARHHARTHRDSGGRTRARRRGRFGLDPGTQLCEVDHARLTRTPTRLPLLKEVRRPTHGGRRGGSRRARCTRHSGWDSFAIQDHEGIRLHAQPLCVGEGQPLRHRVHPLKEHHITPIGLGRSIMDFRGLGQQGVTARPPGLHLGDTEVHARGVKVVQNEWQHNVAFDVALLATLTHLFAKHDVRSAGGGGIPNGGVEFVELLPDRLSHSLLQLGVGGEARCGVAVR